MISPSAKWLNGDRFHELKKELLLKRPELFEELCASKEIAWHWMNFYFIPARLDAQIELSLKAYHDELNSYIQNTHKGKLS